MTLDLKKYGFTDVNFHIDTGKISSVIDPVFVKESGHNAGLTGGIAGTGVEKVLNQFPYTPPIKKLIYLLYI